MIENKERGHYVFCKYITRKDGTRICASSYGKKAFRIFVKN